MRISYTLQLAAVICIAHATASATTFNFGTPFAGSDALTTPGRQINGGELQTDIAIDQDTFFLNPALFGVSEIQFANDTIDNIPATGVNTVVLRTFDNDGDAGTPFGAGTAANLIAQQITTSGPGFFIYFNSGLDLPRLVFSTDLSDNTADLQILARFLNLGGQAGRDAMATFTAQNFTTVPESGSTLVMALAFGGMFWARRYVSHR